MSTALSIMSGAVDILGLPPFLLVFEHNRPTSPCVPNRPSPRGRLARKHFPSKIPARLVITLLISRLIALVLWPGPRCDKDCSRRSVADLQSRDFERIPHETNRRIPGVQPRG